MKIYLDANPSNAPGCFRIESADGRDVLIQTDWEYPKTASYFGYCPCDCGATDGTVDCAHKTASEMIGEAAQFIIDNDGAEADDPGYFD